MASDRSFVDFVVDQIKRPESIYAKSMFGEYGLFCEGKIFALICDNKLFFKPTESGRAFIGSVVEAPPYEGAKNSFLIREQLEDSEWLSKLTELTLSELPEPRKKKKK